MDISWIDGQSPTVLEPVDQEGVSKQSAVSRRCIATGEVQPKDRMVRWVVGPDSVLVPDLAEKLPGRGFWVTSDRRILGQSIRRRLFSRAARQPVVVPDDTLERLEILLRGRCLQLVGLARRAGQAVAGLEKVRSWLEKERAGLLLEARDGSVDGWRKIAASGRGRELPVLRRFDAAELGTAWGRDIVVHGAVAEGSLAQRLLIEARRLDGVTGG